MFVILSFRDDPGQTKAGGPLPDLLDELWRLLQQQPGCQTAVLGRSPDDPGAWVIGVLWQDMGAYRRAMARFDVKIALGGLGEWIGGDSGAFEVVRAAAGGQMRLEPSDRAPDADEVSPGAAVLREWPGSAAQ